MTFGHTWNEVASRFARPDLDAGVIAGENSGNQPPGVNNGDSDDVGASKSCQRVVADGEDLRRFVGAKLFDHLAAALVKEMARARGLAGQKHAMSQLLHRSSLRMELHRQPTEGQYRKQLIAEDLNELLGNFDGVEQTRQAKQQVDFFVGLGQLKAELFESRANGSVRVLDSLRGGGLAGYLRHGQVFPLVQQLMQLRHQGRACPMASSRGGRSGHRLCSPIHAG